MAKTEKNSKLKNWF